MGLFHRRIKETLQYKFIIILFEKLDVIIRFLIIHY